MAVSMCLNSVAAYFILAEISLLRPPLARLLVVLDFRNLYFTSMVLVFSNPLTIVYVSPLRSLTVKLIVQICEQDCVVRNALFISS